MQKEIIKSSRIGDEYVEIKHPSGLTILLCPMKGYSSAYALFGTNYGSIDCSFKIDGETEYTTVPEGIAHFLEHKLFESEDGDAFTKYAKTGANANAYTSFDKTCYLFSTAQNFEESLRILMEFVTSPYFTEETVQKEQGIIGQEISMYDDDPQWRVYFNLLGALYHKHPVRIDIAGTKETIAQINAKLLYQCYNTFYNLNNMVLSIAGNFEVDTVLKLADEILKPAKAITIDRKVVDEPDTIVKSEVVQHLPVASPLFYLGFKEHAEDALYNAKTQVLYELLLEIVAGEGSPIYRKLYDEGFINAVFATEVMGGRDYMVNFFAGESKDPYKVREEMLSYIAQLKKDGIDEATFERCKKAIYGRYVRGFNSVESVASLMLLSHFSGMQCYDVLDVIASSTLEGMNQLLQSSLREDRCALSIVEA